MLRVGLDALARRADTADAATKDSINRLTRIGSVGRHRRRRRSSSTAAWRLVRNATPDDVWLARRLPRGPVGRDLPGRDVRAASRSRSSAATTRRKDNKLEFRSSSNGDSLGRLSTLATARSPCAGSPHPSTFTHGTTGTSSSTIVLEADVGYDLPISRARRQVLPGLEARALEAPGPARRRGRRHRRRPLAQPRPQAAGREGRPAVQDRHAAARVEADRRPQHLQRRLEGRRPRHDDLDDADGLRPGQGPRLRPDLLERQPADVRRAGDLPRRHRLRQRPVRRRQVRDQRREEHDRGRQPAARHRQRQARHPGHARSRRPGEDDRHT